MEEYNALAQSARPLGAGRLSLVGATRFRRGSCLGSGSESRFRPFSLNRLENTIAKPNLALAA
jgi:hypothetical protein